MKTFFSTKLPAAAGFIAIASTMVTSAVLAAAVITQPVAAQQSSPSPISPSPTAEVQPSVEFCQSAMNDAFANGTKILAQLDENEGSVKLSGDTRNVQTVVCMIYFKGVMDGIALSDPKV